MFRLTIISLLFNPHPLNTLPMSFKDLKRNKLHPAWLKYPEHLKRNNVITFVGPPASYPFWFKISSWASLFLSSFFLSFFFLSFFLSSFFFLSFFFLSFLFVLSLVCNVYMVIYIFSNMWPWSTKPVIRVNSWNWDLYIIWNLNK